MYETWENRYFNLFLTKNCIRHWIFITYASFWMPDKILKIIHNWLVCQDQKLMTLLKMLVFWNQFADIAAVTSNQLVIVQFSLAGIFRDTDCKINLELNVIEMILHTYYWSDTNELSYSLKKIHCSEILVAFLQNVEYIQKLCTRWCLQFS